jgi:hypothetical protein
MVYSTRSLVLAAAFSGITFWSSQQTLLRMQNNLAAFALAIAFCFLLFDEIGKVPLP